MKKRCPPGVICFENVTIFVIMIFIFSLLSIIIYKSSVDINKYNSSNIYSNNEMRNNYYRTNETLDYNQDHYKKDILLNPYSAPLRDDRIYNNEYCGPKIPINVSTQGFNTNYRQVGILSRINGGEMILPLMGRPLFRNRDKWNFYTMNDKSNMIKLPITFKNKSCTSSLGCDNLYNGDKVYVEGFNDLFRVTIYDNNVMEYIPYL